MLKGIPSILSPELVKILMEAGHGDSIVLADANFPAASCARRLVRGDGLSIPALLDALLVLFPVDTYEPYPVEVMEPGDTSKPSIWTAYRSILHRHGMTAEWKQVSRFDFYNHARNAFAIVATGETALFGNIILTKGVITEGGITESPSAERPEK